MNKPSSEQVAWVFEHLRQAMKEPGSFRYLIYKRMGFSPEAYSDLCNAGGLELTNAFAELGSGKNQAERNRTALSFIEDQAQLCKLNCPETGDCITDWCLPHYAGAVLKHHE